MEVIKNLLRVVVPRPILRGWHWMGAVIANFIYWFPGRKLRVFAVTGTDGKTTTALLLHSILKVARRKVGLMSTVRFSDGKELWRNDTKLGTQNPFALQRLLRRMVGNGTTEAVLEVTSIGLDQHRIWGVPIDTAMLTNVTSDHLEYHHTKEAYRAAKERLFALIAIAALFGSPVWAEETQVGAELVWTAQTSVRDQVIRLNDRFPLPATTIVIKQPIEGGHRLLLLLDPFGPQPLIKGQLELKDGPTTWTLGQQAPPFGAALQQYPYVFDLTSRPPLYADVPSRNPGIAVTHQASDHLTVKAGASPTP